MSLIDMVTHEEPRGRTDKVLGIYESLSPGEKDTFSTVIRDNTWSSNQIAEALQHMGFDVQGHQLQYFRTKLKTGRVELA